jgi:hypothetical protein
MTPNPQGYLWRRQGRRLPTGTGETVLRKMESDGRRGSFDEMTFAQTKQELVEARNTIAQFRKNQAPFKRQRSEGHNSYRREYGNDSHGQEQQRARKNVTVLESAGPGPKKAASPLKKVQVKMLRTCLSHQIRMRSRNASGPLSCGPGWNR